VNRFWRRWLTVAAGITGVAGLAFAGLSIGGATGLLTTILDILYLPAAPVVQADETALFAVGVMGAVMAGWAVTMLILVRDPDASGTPAVWWALTGGLLSWFVVDGVVSAVAGALGNLALNVAFLALYAPALIATRPGR